MQPKELSIHGRALYRQWICHSPNAMKTDILDGREQAERVVNRLGGVSDLIRPVAAGQSSTAMSQASRRLSNLFR